MARLKKREGESAEGGTWLTTYGDLVTNLLCFFVLLFSMATIDKQRFEEIAFSLRTAYIGKTSGGDLLRSNMGKSIFTVNFVNPDDTGEKRVDNKRYIEAAEELILDDTEIIERKKLERAKEQLEIDVEKLGISDLVEIIDERDYLLVRLNSQVLFESGSAEILSEGKRTLDVIGKSLAQLDNEILVQGHTDNVPINTPLFPSNWELSTKRATNVVVYLINSLNIDPSKLTATGNGEYRPIADNSTPEGRQKNRRIEIMILKN